MKAMMSCDGATMADGYYFHYHSKERPSECERMTLWWSPQQRRWYSDQLLSPTDPYEQTTGSAWEEGSKLPQPGPGYG